MKHECGDNWTRVHRMMPALIQWDADAYRYVTDEFGDCPRCLGNALAVAVYLHTNTFALQAGSLEQAAEYVAQELQRLLINDSTQ
jgi:hypothetical protein